MKPKPPVPADQPPGSPAAHEAGCTCAATDNARGRGHRDLEGRVWWFVDRACPVHAA